jgi:hypothetical protein
MTAYFSADESSLELTSRVNKSCDLHTFAENPRESTKLAGG